MDLESVADELYQATPDDFVERRTARVAEARAAKDRPLVKAITQLRRPTRSAWLVNLLAHESGDEVAALLDLGAALGEAQRQGSGVDLRRLSKERQTTLDRLTREAVTLAAARGHTATEATRQEVSQTLQAALADPSVAELVRTGRVVQPASYGGFGPMDLFGAGLTAAPPAADAAEGAEDGARAQGSGAPQTESDVPPTAAAASPQEERPRRAADEAEAAARAALAEARETLEAARDEAAQAESDADEATAEADRLADQVERLRTQLQEAEEEERQAGHTARAARKRSQELQQVVAAAEQAVSRAEQEVSGDGKRSSMPRWSAPGSGS